jgi:hypothetical protein
VPRSLCQLLQRHQADAAVTSNTQQHLRGRGEGARPAGSCGSAGSSGATGHCIVAFPRALLDRVCEGHRVALPLLGLLPDKPRRSRKILTVECRRLNGCRAYMQTYNLTAG